MMNGKGILAVAIILMCVGFGGVIYEVTSEAPAPRPTRPPVETVAPPSEPTITTPPPTLTTEEQVYLEVMQGLNEIVYDTNLSLSLLLEDPQILDDYWRMEVAIQTSMMRLLYEEIKEIEPPSSLSSFHAKYVESLYHYDKSCDLLVQGIDELDLDLIDEAGEEMEIATQFMEEATQLMTEFVESHT